MSDAARLAELEAQNEALRKELATQKGLAARAMASYQQRALQMEVIRQQNEDLDRLATELARSKRAEEERSRQLAEAARLKSDFLANFSHEIRTPLNGILGYCDLLAREEGARLTPHGRRDLNVIKSNARTLLALINDILDLSKIEAGRLEVVREKVDFAGLVDECVATVKEMVRGKDVIVSGAVDPRAAVVFSDSLKLRQVLLNLLSNAAKFTESGEVQVSTEVNGTTLTFHVEDTGVGIPPEQLEHVFEKFRQVDGSSTRKVGGTGLGLAIVREVSRILGGNVSVVSTLGRGSRFTVTLPGALDAEGNADISSVSKPEPAPPSAPGEALSHVLVIDDDPMIVSLLRGELERAGLTVTAVGDGVAGLAAAKQTKPSAILLDIHLPKLDGWSVLAELKNDPQLAAVPVLIISVEEQRARAFSFGACDYLVKPIDPDKLVETVRRNVTGGSAHVLVVDDDGPSRELVGRQLQSMGFTYTEARDGEEALLKTRVMNPSLIVLDLLMPRRDGFEVLAALRAEGSRVPVIVLTGKELSAQEIDLLRNGIAHVVHKGGLGIEAVAKEAQKVLARAPREAPKLSRVLYIEDSPQNRDIVRRYLHGEFEVLEAEDGEHGLERARREVPDLVLVDLSLPRMDGWETTRHIKATPSLKNVPVIAFTAHVAPEDRQRAMEAGCCDYLTKPIEREVLLAAVRQRLREHKAKANV